MKNKKHENCRPGKRECEKKRCECGFERKRKHHPKSTSCSSSSEEFLRHDCESRSSSERMNCCDYDDFIKSCMCETRNTSDCNYCHNSDFSSKDRFDYDDCRCRRSDKHDREESCRSDRYESYDSSDCKCGFRRDSSECERSSSDEKDSCNHGNRRHHKCKSNYRSDCRESSSSEKCHKNKNNSCENYCECFIGGVEEGYCQGYEEGFNDRCNDQYKCGYDKGFEDGKEEGYKIGCNSGYEKAKQEVQEYVNKIKKCRRKKCCKSC